MIILHDLSDHLPILAMLRQTKLINKEPLTFKSRCLNPEKLKRVNHLLMQKDWVGLLTGTTSSAKFDQLTNVIDCTLDEVSPVKTMRISAKRRFVEPWMTRGLEQLSKKKLALYKKNSMQKQYS